MEITLEQHPEETCSAPSQHHGDYRPGNNVERVPAEDSSVEKEYR